MFNEANTVEAMVHDLLVGPTHPQPPPGLRHFLRPRLSLPEPGRGLENNCRQQTNHRAKYQ
jgi:hypothetical protein